MYTVEELLKAMRIESNPNAMKDFIFLMTLLSLFVLISIIVKNLSKIKSFLVDKKLYSFIIEFKNITRDEKKVLDKLIKDNRVIKKYEILIIEGIYDKYVEREIAHIKIGFKTEEEKLEEIMRYKSLREKLFKSL